MASRTRNQEYWKCLDKVPDEELWESRQTLKRSLITTIQDRAQQRWTRDQVTTQQVIAMGSLLDSFALTIAFARRFTEYKRPYLILSGLTLESIMFLRVFGVGPCQ